MFDLIPWSERRDLVSFRREVDRLFDRFFEGWPFGRSATDEGWLPAMDVSETSKELVAKVEAPGMDPKDIEISIKGDTLTVRGERKQEKEEKDENFHRIERRYGSFSRTVRLPSEIDPDKVKAVYKNGVLKISMPKVKAETVKKIEVKAA
jgi:HSP20 family protein